QQNRKARGRCLVLTENREPPCDYYEIPKKRDVAVPAPHRLGPGLYFSYNRDKGPQKPQPSTSKILITPERRYHRHTNGKQYQGGNADPESGQEGFWVRI